jgi:hypothetical protein
MQKEIEFGDRGRRSWTMKKSRCAETRIICGSRNVG